MYAWDFETYDDFVNEEMVGGAILEEVMSQDDWNQLKENPDIRRNEYGELMSSVEAKQRLWDDIQILINNEAWDDNIAIRQLRFSFFEISQLHKVKSELRFIHQCFRCYKNFTDTFSVEVKSNYCPECTKFLKKENEDERILAEKI